MTLRNYSSMASATLLLFSISCGGELGHSEGSGNTTGHAGSASGTSGGGSGAGMSGTAGTGGIGDGGTSATGGAGGVGASGAVSGSSGTAGASGTDPGVCAYQHSLPPYTDYDQGLCNSGTPCSRGMVCCSQFCVVTDGYQCDPNQAYGSTFEHQECMMPYCTHSDRCKNGGAF